MKLSFTKFRDISCNESPTKTKNNAELSESKSRMVLSALSSLTSCVIHGKQMRQCSTINFCVFDF